MPLRCISAPLYLLLLLFDLFVTGLLVPGCIYTPVLYLTTIRFQFDSPTLVTFTPHLAIPYPTPRCSAVPVTFCLWIRVELYLRLRVHRAYDGSRHLYAVALCYALPLPGLQPHAIHTLPPLPLHGLRCWITRPVLPLPYTALLPALRLPLLFCPHFWLLPFADHVPGLPLVVATTFPDVVPRYVVIWIPRLTFTPCCRCGYMVVSIADGRPARLLTLQRSYLAVVVDVNVPGVHLLI